MPVILEPLRSGLGGDVRRGDSVTIGLVNNMPDAAFEATERQFIDLVGAAASEVPVRLKLFLIPQVSRADHLRGEMAGRYRTISELWNSTLDALIVTGSEPRAARLQDEPYWPALTKLVEWARQNTASTIWSCLAAHAAVLHNDGIERSPFAEKLFGVFECETFAAHPLMRESMRMRVPHSRYNDLPEAALTSCGYRLLSRSAAAGADAFVKQQQGASLFVFLQGHPEYDTDSLLREYRRDVGRFLRGEREHYPAAPQGYLDEEAMALLSAFRARAADDRRGSLIVDFPMADLEARLANTWRETAIAIYQNWIAFLRDRKKERRFDLAGAVLAPRRSIRQPAARRRVAATAGREV